VNGDKIGLNIRIDDKKLYFIYEVLKPSDTPNIIKELDSSGLPTKRVDVNDSIYVVVNLERGKYYHMLKVVNNFETETLYSPSYILYETARQKDRTGIKQVEAIRVLELSKDFVVSSVEEYDKLSKEPLSIDYIDIITKAGISIRIYASGMVAIASLELPLDFITKYIALYREVWDDAHLLEREEDE
jgi:hypothetical protein